MDPVSTPSTPPNGWRRSFKVALVVATLLPLVTVGWFFTAKVVAVAETPQKVDSLRVQVRQQDSAVRTLLQQHVDSSAKYGRLGWLYQRATYCTTMRQAERSTCDRRLNEALRKIAGVDP